MMEVQDKDTLQTPDLSTPQRISTPRIPSSSASVPSLRFPRPQGSTHLANWVSSSSPDIRQPLAMSEAGSNLADSAFEIIRNTDTESQDGRMSESTGSLDVHSLDGSETHFDTESEEEEEESSHSSHASSIRYADQVLENPLTHVLAATPPYSSTSTEGSGVILDYIELREEDNDESANPDKISARHVVREFVDLEAMAMQQHLRLPVAPRHLVATVRQTMSQAYLSTVEPLRVLYVGRADAKRAVVIKISNAIWASSSDDAQNSAPFGRREGGVYNIVPISSFGSSPELDLMESSEYQIKVEHCTSATEHPEEQKKGHHTRVSKYSMSIGINQEKTYDSVISSEGHFIEPQWTRPHIAVFYCPDDESAEEGQTREAAWKCLKGHRVPSIFISESSLLGKPDLRQWSACIDEDAVHLCIESRDPERPIVPQRLPIDLASFNNIDARQMNRNLAYLMGLTGSSRTPHTPPAGSVPWKTAMSKTWGQRPSREQILESIEENKWFIAILVPIVMAILAPMLSEVVVGWTKGPILPAVQQTTTSHALGVSPTPCTGRFSNPSKPVDVSTTTVIINVTSTKTVQISRVSPSTSAVASALSSIAGLLSDRPPDVPAELGSKKTLCSVRIHGPNEFLVTLPPGSKLSASLDVRRGDLPLKKKLSPVAEGILVEINQDDAYGILNVSIVSTRRPKINETFEIDFGKAMVAEAFEAGLNFLQGLAKVAYSAVDDVVGVTEKTQLPGVVKLRDEATSAWDQALDAGKRRYETTVSQVKDSLGPNLEQAREVMSNRLGAVKRVRDEVDLSILEAQIRARLWWLNVWGKMEEFAEYERNATALLRRRYAETQEKYKAEGGSRSKHSGNKWTKSDKDKAKLGESKDRSWKKMMMG